MMHKSHVIQQYINKLLQRQNLSFAESVICGHELLTSANEVQIAGFLSLLAAKGETVDELVGLVTVIRKNAVKLEVDCSTLDIVGTGGDFAATVNISTASCLLSAACGISILKHGNRAVSSQSGAADVLEVLGYPINLSPEEIKLALQKDNFAFCFTPNYHPLLAHMRKIRKNLGFATAFNLLGPLLNPVGLNYMLIGIYDKTKLELIANALCKLGTKCSIVFHGSGLDELSCLGKMDAYVVKGNKVEPININPQELGLELCSLDDLKGGDALYNARVIEDTLSGIKTGLTDTLLLNTAVALFVFGKVATIVDGIILARKRLSEGNVIRPNRLREIVRKKQRPILSNEFQQQLDTILEQLATPNLPPQLTFTKNKSFSQALLAKTGGAVISEIKRASPSAGKISAIVNPAQRSSLYVSLGAAAVSVLTDEHFEGSIEDLISVATALQHTNAPVLHKEFILYPEQVVQSKICGADAILLMVSVLGEKTQYFVDLAHAFGLEALVEIHTSHELAIARKCGGDIILVNQRDLRDFSMHAEVFSKLIGQLPDDVVKMAVSGMKTGSEAKAVLALGYDAVLVGEALSRLADPSEFFNQVY